MISFLYKKNVQIAVALGGIPFYHLFCVHSHFSIAPFSIGLILVTVGNKEVTHVSQLTEPQRILWLLWYGEMLLGFVTKRSAFLLELLG